MRKATAAEQEELEKLIAGMTATVDQIAAGAKAAMLATPNGIRHVIQAANELSGGSPVPLARLLGDFALIGLAQVVSTLSFDEEGNLR